MNKSIIAFGAVVSALMLSPCASRAQTKLPNHIMAQGYYLREPTDRAWTLKLTGEVPSMPGMYVIMHDSDGKLMYKAHVPGGPYPADKPFIKHFPADGKTGDYKVVFAGQQNDMLGLDLPLSDLPYEVYGGGWFHIGFSKAPIAFMPGLGVSKMGMRAFRGYIRVVDDKEQVVADAHAGINVMVPNESNKNFYNVLDHPIEFPVEAGKVYWLTATNAYIEPRDAIFFSYDPTRLFVPDHVKLDAVKWWELVS